MTMGSSEQSTGGAPISVTAQLLSTEHWSLLATRNLVWSESFSRATWFVTVVSAAMVAMALVANSTDFGSELRLFAVLVIPLLVAVGAATIIRLAQLNTEDVALVIGMNRLRRGYLDLSPEIEPYFVTGHTEDLTGVMRTYGAQRTQIPMLQFASSIALLVGVVVSVLIGALAGLVADSLEVGLGTAVTIGILVVLASLIGTTVLLVRHIRRTWPGGPLVPATDH
jgi:hypothetical protein